MLSCCKKHKKVGIKDKDILDYIVETSFEDECIICLQVIDQSQNASLLKCGHVFHTQCIYKWFLKKRECPLCDIHIQIT